MGTSVSTEVNKDVYEELTKTINSTKQQIENSLGIKLKAVQSNEQSIKLDLKNTSLKDTAISMTADQQAIFNLATEIQQALSSMSDAQVKTNATKEIQSIIEQNAQAFGTNVSTKISESDRKIVNDTINEYVYFMKNNVDQEVMTEQKFKQALELSALDTDISGVKIDYMGTQGTSATGEQISSNTNTVSNKEENTTTVKDKETSEVKQKSGVNIALLSGGIVLFIVIAVIVYIIFKHKTQTDKTYQDAAVRKSELLQQGVATTTGDIKDITTSEQFGNNLSQAAKFMPGRI